MWFRSSQFSSTECSSSSRLRLNYDVAKSRHSFNEVGLAKLKGYVVASDWRIHKKCMGPYGSHLLRLLASSWQTRRVGDTSEENKDIKKEAKKLAP